MTMPGFGKAPQILDGYTALLPPPLVCTLPFVNFWAVTRIFITVVSSKCYDGHRENQGVSLHVHSSIQPPAQHPINRKGKIWDSYSGWFSLKICLPLDHTAL